MKHHSLAVTHVARPSSRRAGLVGARSTLEAVRLAWERAVERVKTWQKEALTGAKTVGGNGAGPYLANMEGYDELRRHFELEARKKPLTPPSTEKPSELSQQLEVLSNDMQQAAAAPRPEVSDFKEKMTKRLDSVKAFRQRIRELEQTVRDSKVEADIEQFELLVRVQEGLEKALNDRLS